MQSQRNPNFITSISKFYAKNSFDDHKSQIDQELDHMSSKFQELHLHFQNLSAAIHEEVSNQNHKIDENLVLSNQFLQKWSYKGSALKIKGNDEITYQYYTDDKNREYGQIIFHNKQIISLTEYDEFDRKI